MNYYLENDIFTFFFFLFFGWDEKNYVTWISEKEKKKKKDKRPKLRERERTNKKEEGERRGKMQIVVCLVVVL